MFNVSKFVPVAGVLALASQVSMAAVDAGVTTAITTASADGATLVGALAAAGAAVFIIYKLLKKFGIML